MKITENKINPSDNQTKQSANPEEKKHYDPSKTYIWDPNTMFTIRGAEFGLILNSLRNIITTPEAQRILIASKAHNALEESLKAAVEAGIVKEK